jgi:hypothetical protein
MNGITLLILSCCLVASYASMSTIRSRSFVQAHGPMTCDGMLKLSLNFTTVNTHGTDTISFMTFEGNVCNDLEHDPLLDPHAIVGMIASLSVINVTNYDGVLRNHTGNGVSCFIFRNERYHDVTVKYNTTSTCANDSVNGVSPWLLVLVIVLAVIVVVVIFGCGMKGNRG